MNKIKMFITTIAIAFTGNAMAQELSAEKVEIAANGEAELVVKLGGTRTDLTAAQFYLTLPTGIELVEENYEYKAAVGADQAGYEVRIEDKSDSHLVLITRKNSKVPALKLGDVVSITLKAGASVGEGLKAKISGIEFAVTGTAVEGNADFEVEIAESTTTGINGITADQLKNGEVYNIQGQKVNAANKGVYVVNGKKVVVK